MFRDDGPGLRGLLGALQAPATSEELAGEEKARALFTTFLPEPAPSRRRRVLPGVLVAAAVATVSIGAMALADGLTPSSPAGLTPAAVVEQRDGRPTSASSRVGAIPLGTPSSVGAGPMAGDTSPTNTTPAPGAPLAPRAEHAGPSTSAPVTTSGLSISRPPTSTPSTTQTTTSTPTTTPTSGTRTPPGESAVPLCRAYRAEKITTPRLERLTEYAGGTSSIDPFCTSLLAQKT